MRRRATQIAQVTRSRFMPPWKVEPGVGHFVGQRPLDDTAIALIEQWAKSGTPEGDPKQLPALPKFADGWLLGKPDLIVKPDAAFTLPAQQTDAFRIFAIRMPVTKRTYVTGIEFHPGNARVVHHANIRIDRTPATRRLDEADPLPGYDGLMPRSAEYPDGHFLGWTPGQIAPLVQPELAWTLEPGSDLVVQLHLQPSGAVEEVLPEIGFYFTDRTPMRTPTILRLGSQGIDIPPGEPRYVIRDSYVLPVDVQLLAVQPHAHYRAKEIRGVAAVAGRHVAAGDAHQGLGFPLAARVSRRDADSAAERHAAVDGIHLRQLGDERPQSRTAAGARVLGTALARRDGRPVVPAARGE